MSEGSPDRLAAGDPEAGFISRYAGIPDAGWGGLAVLLGVAVAIVVGFAGLLFVAAFDPELKSTGAKDAGQLVVALALGGTAAGFAFVFAEGQVRDALARLGLDRFSVGAIGLALLALLAYLAVAAVLAPILSPDQKDVTRELGTDTGSARSVLVTGLLLVVAAPIAEELFFRGFMFAGLRRLTGGDAEGPTTLASIWPAAVISALVWGSLHLSSGDVGVALQLSAFGVILAWLYERSGTLWAPILAHAINNTIAFVLLLTDAI